MLENMKFTSDAEQDISLVLLCSIVRYILVRYPRESWDTLARYPRESWDILVRLLVSHPREISSWDSSWVVRYLRKISSWDILVSREISSWDILVRYPRETPCESWDILVRYPRESWDILVRLLVSREISSWDILVSGEISSRDILVRFHISTRPCILFSISKIFRQNIIKINTFASCA